MMSALLVSAGNYFYNLVLCRVLGPEKFADAAIMITFLLVLSFVAMTFQLVTAKFSIIFENVLLNTFISTTFVTFLYTHSRTQRNGRKSGSPPLA